MSKRNVVNALIRGVAVSENYRQCPVCKKGRVRVSELRHGAECNHCRSVVEVDAFYSLGFPLLLALGWLTLFRLDHGIAAVFLVAVTVIYAIGIYPITGRWFPLKSYDS